MPVDFLLAILRQTRYGLKEKIVKLYHRTARANEILADGFRDSSGHYLTRSGVDRSVVVGCAAG